jgi:hypothetical protein
VQSKSLVQIFIHVAGVGGGKIEGNQAHAGAYAAFAGDGGGHFGEHIHVVEAGGAAAQHFSHRQSGAGTDESGLDPAGFGGPDMVLQPGHQRQIVRQSPQQGHAGMGVSVDQTRDQDVRFEIEVRLGANGPLPRPRQDGENAAILDGDGVVFETRWPSGSTGTIQRALSRVAMACGMRGSPSDDGGL